MTLSGLLRLVAIARYIGRAAASRKVPVVIIVVTNTAVTLHPVLSHVVSTESVPVILGFRLLTRKEKNSSESYQCSR